MKKLVISMKGSSLERKIELIKDVRSATGLGLKESKDLCDRIAAGEKIEIEVTGDDFSLLKNFEVLVTRSEEDFRMDDIFQELMVYLVKNKAVDVGEQVLNAYRMYINWQEGR